MDLCVYDNCGSWNRIGRSDPQEGIFERIDNKMLEECHGTLNTYCMYHIPCQPGDAVGTKIYTVLNTRILQEQSVSLSHWYQKSSESCSC